MTILENLIAVKNSWFLRLWNNEKVQGVFSFCKNITFNSFNVYLKIFLLFAVLYIPYVLFKEAPGAINLPISPFDPNYKIKGFFASLFFNFLNAMFLMYMGFYLFNIALRFIDKKTFYIWEIFTIDYNIKFLKLAFGFVFIFTMFSFAGAILLPLFTFLLKCSVDTIFLYVLFAGLAVWIMSIFLFVFCVKLFLAHLILRDDGFYKAYHYMLSAIQSSFFRLVSFSLINVFLAVCMLVFLGLSISKFFLISQNPIFMRIVVYVSSIVFYSFILSYLYEVFLVLEKRNRNVSMAWIFFLFVMFSAILLLARILYAVNWLGFSEFF